MNRKYLWIFPALLTVLGLSCRSENRVMEQEDLFILPMGYMADELNYFVKPDSQMPGTSDLFIHEGRVFLSSSNSGKIMELNSYGDLLGFYYNPTINPEPAQYMTEDGDNPVVIKKWNFRGVERLAVTDDYLLVADRVEESQSEQADGVLRNRIVLRFDRKGEYVDFLGKEGVQTTPFGFVQDLEVTSSGETVVITKEKRDYQVYWFSKEGRLLYQVNLDAEHLPPLEEEGWGPGIPETIKPDKNEHKLYIKMDYFPLVDSENMNSVSRLYTLDLQAEVYSDFFEVDNLEVEMNGQQLEGVYEYLGPTASGLHFFLGADFNGRYHLNLMNAEGAVKATRIMYIQDSNILFRRFFLSEDGLLASVFYEARGARVSWWRTDKLADRYAD